ncbi:hypothetical protein E2K93_09715 [Thalassotalea sp. HSM 43]|uniref:hypothetical protein n=1 Tax=Thalassotalea sp. HSM 43 TaxID=2552945 RepID=UPI0010817780|nr:hypothetical protein [Thalassotalea sp. HSM 43]QBY04649.1 hypothetical protein E2K93_09715 [Thalassotalea sp. HSM 43]
MNNTLKIIAALSLLAITGCKSTETVTTPVQQVNYQNVFQFNMHVEALLQQQDAAALKALYSSNKALKLRQPSRIEKTFGANWQQAYANSIFNLFMESQVFWSYQSTRQLDKNTVRTLFRGDSDDGFHFVELEIDKNSYKIIDAHDLSTMYSTTVFLNRVSDIEFCATDAKPVCQAEDAFKGLLMSASNKDGANVLKHYDSLSAEQMALPFIQDLNIRLISLHSNWLPKTFVTRVINDFTRMDTLPYSFEGLLIEQGKLELALKALDSAPQQIRDNSVMLLEKAAIYGELNNHKTSIKLSHQAIFNEPNLVESYVVLLVSAIADKDFKLAMATINVLEKRFAIELDEQALSEMISTDEFVASEIYQQSRKS